MVSAAEQLASNLNFGAFAKAEELKKRLWFTLAALVVYRLGTYIPIPGINPAAFAESFKAQSSGILGMFNMFAGGAVERMAIFALNIMPYISASIIMQLMTSVVPTLEQLKKEGEQGRKQINQYTRYVTVALAAFQAYGIAFGLEGSRGASGPVVIDPRWFFRISTVVTLVGGTMFLMWLGEQSAQLALTVEHASVSAQAAGERAGGTITLIERKVLPADEAKRSKTAAKKAKSGKAKGAREP